MAEDDGPPRRRISTMAHLDAFLESPACADLEAFARRLSAEAAGKATVAGAAYAGGCAGVRGMLGALDAASARVAAFPPQREVASRFGNVAFRSWMEATEAASEADMRALTEERPVELAGYWVGSFGNKNRLDYGTGHEASFLVWLLATVQLGVSEDMQGLALCVFPRYIALAHQLQTTYRLEPAGSHGVWSLDDYHFLPFVLGSAQLSAGADGSAGGVAARPSALRSGMAVDELAGSNLFMHAVQRIAHVKTGPFAEHSPLLADIAAHVPSWGEASAGLTRMFVGEVLGKFPVAQHFLFGPLWPCTWALSAEEIDALDNAQVATGAAAAPRSPFDVAVRRTGTGDPLQTYFGVSRRGQAKGRAGAGLGAGLGTGLGAGLGLGLGKGLGKGLGLGQGRQPPAPGAVDHELLDGEAGIRIGGWTVESTGSARISGEAEAEVAKRGHAFLGRRLDFPLPEMLFAGNVVRLSHAASGVALEFNALDALCGCKISRGSDGEPDRTLFKLPSAEAWAKRRTMHGEEIKEWRDDYDWTYTTLYGGSLRTRGAAEAGGAGGAGKAEEAEEGETTSAVDFAGGDDGSGSGEEDGPGVDYDMLRARDPILYFDEASLFEDDLLDNGEAKLTVKLRVMPRCLFVLCRFWLRVDGTFVRCFDTRVFHKFGSPHLVLEVSRKEAAASVLKARNTSGKELRVLMMDEAKVEQLLDTVERRTVRVPLTPA